MATSSTTPPQGTPIKRPDSAQAPAGATRKRATTGASPAAKRKAKPAAVPAGSAPVVTAPSAAVPVAAQPPIGGRMSDVERQRRIEEAAYRKAEARGFGGNRHVEDWLEAERELDAGNSTGTARSR